MGTCFQALGDSVFVLLRTLGQSGKFCKCWCREILHLLNRVGRILSFEDSLKEGWQIKPLVWCFVDAPVVQVVAVDIDNRSHLFRFLESAEPGIRRANEKAAFKGRLFRPRQQPS